MAEESLALVVEVRPARTCRAEVILVHDDKSVSVVCDGTESGPYRCAVLETREGGGLQFKPGDRVLVVQEEERSGIILGRIASADNVADEPPNTQGVAPDQLVIESQEEPHPQVWRGFDRHPGGRPDPHQG